MMRTKRSPERSGASKHSGASKRMVKLWVPLTVAWAVPLLVLTLTPIGGASNSQEDDDSAAVVAAAQEEEADTAVVQRVDRDLKETVRLSFELESEPLPKLAAEGLVTQVHVKAGGPVAEGDELISVDRVKLRAHRGEVPFHRELSSGAIGDDVVELARFLTALGYDSSTGANSRLDAGMVGDVKAFQRDIGATPDGVFQPQSTIHIPADVRRIGKVTVAVGDLVAPGDTFTKNSSRAVGGSIDSLGTNDLKVADHSGPFTLEVPTGEDRLNVSLDSLAFTAKQASALREQLLEEGVELTPGAEGRESLQGPSLALATPDVIGTAPMGALYATPTGTICVFEVTSPDDDLAGATAVPVHNATAFVGALAQAAIDAELVGRTIVREVAQLAAETTAQCETADSD